MKRLFAEAAMLAALALIPALGSGWLQQEKITGSSTALEPGEVLLDDAVSWGPAALWIDARSRMIYEQGHVPGALPLNEDAWEALLPAVLEAWTPDRKIVVYCDSRLCRASHDVARRLRKETGLSDVHVLHGGWSSWQSRSGS